MNILKAILYLIKANLSSILPTGFIIFILMYAIIMMMGIYQVECNNFNSLKSLISKASLNVKLFKLSQFSLVMINLLMLVYLSLRVINCEVFINFIVLNHCEPSLAPTIALLVAFIDYVLMWIVAFGLIKVTGVSPKNVNVICHIVFNLFNGTFFKFIKFFRKYLKFGKALDYKCFPQFSSYNNAVAISRPKGDYETIVIEDYIIPFNLAPTGNAKFWELVGMTDLVLHRVDTSYPSLSATSEHQSSFYYLQVDDEVRSSKSVAAMDKECVTLLAGDIEDSKTDEFNKVLQYLLDKEGINYVEVLTYNDVYTCSAGRNS